VACLEQLLADQRPRQLALFEVLAPEFRARYEELDTRTHRFLAEEWRARNSELAESLRPQPPREFIRHPVILFTMFVDGKHNEEKLRVAESVLEPNALGRVLGEDPVGGPPLCSWSGGGLITSSNTIHHTHHLARFIRATEAEPSRIASVVEWGGGYGNLAKLFRRLHGGAPTYVIVDTPLFSCIQWLYLSSIFGRDQVELITGADTPIAKRKINLVPITAVEQVPLTADLFVSTWALNESTPEAQRYVIDRDWFAAPHLLLGIHDGEPLIDAACRGGAECVPVGAFMAHQNYVLR
jgi:putative sugar O-methyltransferase